MLPLEPGPPRSIHDGRKDVNFDTTGPHGIREGVNLLHQGIGHRQTPDTPNVPMDENIPTGTGLISPDSI